MCSNPSVTLHRRLHTMPLLLLRHRSHNSYNAKLQHYMPRPQPEPPIAHSHGQNLQQSHLIAILRVHRPPAATRGGWSPSHCSPEVSRRPSGPFPTLPPPQACYLAICLFPAPTAPQSLPPNARLPAPGHASSPPRGHLFIRCRWEANPPPPSPSQALGGCSNGDGRPSR